MISPVAFVERLPPNLRGALWLVTGGFIFTTVGVMIRTLSTEIESVQIAFFRAVLGMAFLVPILWRAKVVPWRTRRWGAHFWRTAVGTASMVCGFYAVSMLPLADATALSFSQPLFSVVLAALLMGETVRWRRWTATVVGFAGVLIMMRPDAGVFQFGALVAIANALLTAIAVMLVKKLSETEAPLVILSTFALFSTVLLVVPAIWVWRWPSAEGWLLAIGIGVVATVGQYFWVRAFAVGEMSAVAPFEYLRLPFAVLVGFVVFGELPSVWTYVGAAVVIGSALYIAHREATLRKAKKAVVAPDPAGAD